MMSRAKVLAALALVPLSMAQSAGIVLLGSDLHDGFYGETPPFSVDGGSWLGLVAEEPGHALRPAALEWIARDVAPGADSPTFGLSADLDGPLILLSGVAGPRSGPVASASPSALDLSESMSVVTIELGGQEYELGLDSAYPEECRAVVTLREGERSQSIPVEAELGCGDPHFTIHWAGDLDADGELDFVATFSMKYSYHPRRLYLSSSAGPEELVGLAAETARTAG